MNVRPLLLAAALSLFSASALAAPVFMLQFGSFETKEEATTHLNDVKTKHAGVVGSLPTTIREITLPPDNLTVFRTQAGPVANKAEAQAMCAKLTTGGEQCYVVETAMVGQAAPATTAAAPPAFAPKVTDKPADKSSTSGPMPWASAPIVAAQSSAPRTTELPARDAANISTIEGVMKPGTGDSVGFRAAPPPEPPVPAVPVMDSRPLETALDEAATRQSAAGESIPKAEKVETATPKKEQSFWSRMNPFSENEEAPKAVAAAPVSDTAQAAPIDRVAAAEPAPSSPPPLPPIPDMAVTAEAPAMSAAPPAPPTAPIIISRAEPPVPPPAAPLPSLALVTAAAEPPPAAAPLPPLPVERTAPAVEVPMAPPTASGSPLALPPPPAPLRARDREDLAAGRVPQSAPQVLAPTMMPQRTGDLPPVTAITAPSPVAVPPVPAVPFKEGPSVVGRSGEASGQVRVGEAQRVPLTDPGAMPAITATAVPPPAQPVATAQLLPPALEPSATAGKKTLWAQIGQFPDAQAALSFWDSYRRAHPDFPVVRVRVTSPYQAQLRGMTEVSLRVGPFARPESVQNLCSTLPGDRLQCSGITDLGMTADPKGPPAGTLPGSRYNR